MSEVETKIKDSIAEIKPYRFFASEIDLAVKALEELDTLTKNLDVENKKKAMEIVTSFLNQIAAYRSYIPRTASNLEFVKEWLEKQ
ncbi:MAG: hypothetical protein NWE76_01995 [Candidatus Bathyarchaeota archaeon]|nr:hypothetical protein [Candidatus Bathyarchaeota archaeon]